MHTLDTEIEIGADPDGIWSILTDFGAYPRWNPFVRSITGVPEKDATLDVHLQLGDAKARSFRVTLLAVDRPGELSWRGRFMVPGILDGEHRFTIEALSNGKARFRHRAQFGGVLVPFLRRTLDGPVQRGFVEMNVALKERAEASVRENLAGALMFDQDERCVITKVVGIDAASRPIFGETIDEPCSVAKFMGHDSGASAHVRSAPEYPTSPDRVADAVILLRMTTRAAVNDMIEFAGVRLKVIGISQNYDSVGKVSNYIAEAMLWE
jgi:hypothetical protein